MVTLLFRRFPNRACIASSDSMSRWNVILLWGTLGRPPPSQLILGNHQGVTREHLGSCTNATDFFGCCLDLYCWLWYAVMMHYFTIASSAHNVFVTCWPSYLLVISFSIYGCDDWPSTAIKQALWINHHHYHYVITIIHGSLPCVISS